MTAYKEYVDWQKETRMPHLNKRGEKMRLLIKQRVFSWRDSYDVYDEAGNPKYTVKAEWLSLGHQLHVYDRYDNEIGAVCQHLLTFMPAFDIEQGGRVIGTIKKKFTFFSPSYEVSYKGWRVEGDFFGWDYEVREGNSEVMRISKEPFHWGDTYVIDIANPEDEIAGLMLVIAIDAANCSNN